MPFEEWVAVKREQARKWPDNELVAWYGTASEEELRDAYEEMLAHMSKVPVH